MCGKSLNSKGFTIIELLIVVAISGFVLGSVLKVFQTNQRTYAVQEEIAAMNQNVRVGKMFIEREARMAGFGSKNFYDGTGKAYAVVFDNANGAAGSDKLTTTYIDPEAGDCGEDPAGVTPSCDDLPQVTLKDAMPPTSSEAIVNEDLTTAPYSAWDENCYCNGSVYTQPQPGFAAVITAPDGSSSDMFFLTGTQANSDKLQNSANFTAENGITYPNKVMNTYPPGSTIKFFNMNALSQVVYDLVDGVLRRNGDAVAENIEDLQFAFGLDTDGSGTIDSWINNANLTNAQKDQVRSIRIGVLGRTAGEHIGYTGNRPALEDHGAGGTQNRYRRKLLQSSMKVRNLNL